MSVRRLRKVHRVRRRLDKGVRGWIVQHSKRNYWRVASWMDLEDLIQDGYVCYCQCLRKYEHVTEQRHFMALLKTTFHNHITDLATKRTKTIDVAISSFVSSDCVDVFTTLENMAPEQPEEATFAVLLTQLPRELRDLLVTLANDAIQFPRERNETINQWLCRLAGLSSHTFDIETTLRKHFGLLETRRVEGTAGAQLVYVEGQLSSKPIRIRRGK